MKEIWPPQPGLVHPQSFRAVWKLGTEESCGEVIQSPSAQALEDTFPTCPVFFFPSMRRQDKVLVNHARTPNRPSTCPSSLHGSRGSGCPENSTSRPTVHIPQNPSIMEGDLPSSPGQTPAKWCAKCTDLLPSSLLD
ncbi:hypothetical protein LZ30DRAFT_389524 [Colletotrichum cereale]|nr:hypothetical protein LZ30DRAFT_389524 [Colletotrichum cereale]